MMLHKYWNRTNGKNLGRYLPDFLKVGMTPIAMGRILVYATPRQIHEVELRSKRLTPHALNLFVTPQGLSHTILDDVPIEPFLHRAPTLIVMIVSIDQNLAQVFARVAGEGGFLTWRQVALGNDRRARDRVID